MAYDPERYHRRSVRLKNYDYSQAGAYYVTICTHQREDLFGKVMDGEMRCDVNGQIIVSCWEAIADHWPNVDLDAFVVMPNHIHGILVITDDPMYQNVGAGFPRPLALPGPFEANTGAANTGAANTGAEGEGTSPLRQKVRKPTLGAVVAYFKYQSVKRINQVRNTPGLPIWQRSYHDRIIHDDRMWNNAQRYIADNPTRWAMDINNPTCLPQL